MMPRWSKEEDAILVETILHHLRTGSTQKSAIEEVSKKIGRTIHACNFRWKTIREDYEEEVRQAKNKSETKEVVKEEKEKSVELNFKDVLVYLESMYQKSLEAEKNKKIEEYEAKIRQLEAELERLKEENRDLEATIGTIRIAVEQQSS